MNSKKNALLSFFFLWCLLAVISLMYVCLPGTFLLGNSTITTIYMIFLCIAFYLYIWWTMVKGQVRYSLLWCAALCTLFCLLRGFRYIAYTDLEHLSRYLWYLYYIPTLMIPFCSFRAAYFVEKTEDSKQPAWLWIVEGITLLMIALIITNDFHQMAFQLNPGFREHWIEDYTYNFLYYIVYLWVILLLYGSYGLLLYKCKIKKSRSYAWITLLYAVICNIWISYIPIGIAPRINGHLVLQYPETFCFSVASIWIFCIHCGIVPGNKGYVELFRLSNVRALISDLNGESIYRSHNPIEHSSAEKKLQTQKKSIRGGSVIWQSDITEIAKMTEELHSKQQQLQEETHLIRLENELKEKQAVIKSKNALYDAIAVRVFEQSQKITELSAYTEADPALRSKNLNIICFYGSYIKRMSNLMLLGAQDQQISEMELVLAIAESLNQLTRLGIGTAIHAEESLRVYPTADVLSSYETFQQFVESFLPGLTGVYVNITEGLCKLTLEVDAAAASVFRRKVPENARKNPLIRMEWDEESCFVKLPIRRRGEPS